MRRIASTPSWIAVAPEAQAVESEIGDPLVPKVSARSSQIPSSAASPEPAQPADDYRERYRRLTGRSLGVCPCCAGPMMPLGVLARPARPSPPPWPDTS